MKSKNPNIKTKELLAKVEELKLDIEKKEDQIKELYQLSKTTSFDNKAHLEIEKISKVGIWKIFLPELVVEWSDELYNIYEIEKSPEELDYKTFLEYIHPSDRAKTQKELELAIVEKKLINITHRIITSSGLIKVLKARGQVYYDKNDHPIEILGATQDITELIEFEQTKWESEENFSTLFNNSPSPLAITTLNDGKIIEVNTAFCELTALQKKELIGKNTTDLNLWPDENARAKFIQLLKNNRSVKNFESTRFNNEGKQQWILLSAEIIKFNNKESILTAVTDITERKESELLLEMANIVIQNSPAILFKWKASENWEVEYVSENISQFGYTPEEFLTGKVSYASIIHPDDLEKVIEEVKQYSNDGSIHFRQEYRIITKEKKVIWIDDRTMIERDETGSVNYFQGVVMDITHQKAVESALWETQQMLSLVLDNIPQRIFWKDTKFNYMGCNKPFAIDAGLKFPDQILGKNDFELSWKDVAHLYRADDEEIIEKQITKINYEEPQSRGDGLDIWLRTSKLPLKDKDGNLLGLLGCYEDITDRKLAEEALYESEKRFRNFVSQTSDGFYILATNSPINLNNNIEEQLNDSYGTFYVKECNDVFAQMYGYSSSVEILNVTLKEIHGDWDIEQNRKTFKKFLKSDFKVRNSESIEYDINNNKKYFVNNFIGILEDNHLKEIWGTQQDITLRKESELALINSEEKFRSVFTDSHDCIYVTSSDGKIINMNSAGLDLFQIPKSEIQNFNIADIYNNSDERKKFQDDINKKGYVKDYPVILKTVNNKKLNCILTASIRKDEAGSIIGYQGIIRDISKEKRAQEALVFAKEQAEKADRLKTEFLAQMSHEIRTPINTILSFSSLIKEETVNQSNDELSDYFNYQNSAGKRIIRTIDMILNMSEIQSGSFQTNITRINLVEILSEIVKEYSGLSKQKGLELTLSLTKQKTYIRGDEYSIRQIFSNLIDNSIKYTNIGSIELDVKSLSETVVVKISDTGIGISNNYIEELFHPFSQEEQGYSRKFEGSGLGLALVKKYCEINNAKISVESKKNKGTTFSVSLSIYK